MKKRLGNENSIRLWFDPCGTICFKYLFPRLFNVSNNKEETVAGLLEWQSDNDWRWKLNWGCQLFVWEKELEYELLDRIAGVLIGYAILVEKCGGQPLQTANQQLLKACNNLWRNSAPSKIMPFGWKALMESIVF